MSASNKDESEQLTQLIEDLSIKNDSVKDSLMRCTACGKEGDGDNMNTCNKCKAVKYCNAACKKKHKSKHKKACERRVAELYDQELFKGPPPPREDCPICFLPLPLDPRQSAFKSCCGKLICIGCVYAMALEGVKRGKKKEELGMCAFCRMPLSNLDEERIKQLTKQIEKGSGKACCDLAKGYANGSNGMPQDTSKANELYLKAGELGCSHGYYNLGCSYLSGMGVEVDKVKAKHYFELSAMMGDVYARFFLGYLEAEAGNTQRAFKHFILSAKCGCKDSLSTVKSGFMDGDVTKEEYESTLRAYHNRHAEMKSDMRDIATNIPGICIN